MPRKDPLDFQQYTLLGGIVSSLEGLEIFKTIAKLGYEEAEQYMIVEFIEWLVAHPEATVEEIMKKEIELLGMAHFLPLTNEITKLSMIVGSRTKSKAWK